LAGGLIDLLPFVLAAVIIRPLFLFLAGSYRTIWRYATARDFLTVAISILAGSLCLLFLNYFVLKLNLIYLIGKSVIFLEGSLSLLLLLSLRFFLSKNIHYSGDIDWQKTGLEPGRRTLIIGAGTAGIYALNEIRNNPYLGLQVVAFLDDDPAKINMNIANIKVHGPVITLKNIAQKLSIEEVIIAIPSAADQTVKNIQNICQEASLPYRTVPYLSGILGDIEEPVLGTGVGLRLPMSMPDITPEEIKAVVKVMQSRNLSIGSQTVLFEKLIAEQADAKHAIAVSNGTSALHMCMVAANVGPGDEVITSPFSFISSANCILFERASPVFVDIDPNTLNIDPAKIGAAITERTKAIIPVHIFGQPADMDPIMKLAEKYGLIVIEDACEAIGAHYKGRSVGTIGKAGTFAFYPNKQMTTGEGAAIVTNDGAWADLLRSLRNQGRDIMDGWLNHSRLGYNYRMSELNAAVGVVQLKRLDEILKKRNEVADLYKKTLTSIDEVKTLDIVPTTTRMSWFVYVVRLQKGIDRDLIINEMAKLGIPTRPYFTPIHLQSFYRERFGYKPGSFPVSESAGESTIALPFHNNMKIEEIKIVCDTLKNVILKNRS
jgi:perosamine synthetase